MTDFDYDVMQKKRIASGAYHRKGTTNRKGCVLPHELLKPKELKKLNGEITTVSMMRPITWEQFKGLALDLQEEYLNTQIRRFGAGLAVISAPPGRQPKAARESWKRWLASENKIAPEDDDPFEEIEEADCHGADAPRNDAGEVKPFRAHDHKADPLLQLFADCGLERDGLTEDVPENIYPLTDLNLTLIGTPIDILATLRMSFPALLDKDKTYRFQIKADTFTKRWTTEDA